MSGASVFISYRRSNGSELAEVMRAYLEAIGFDVFMDGRAARSGHFDEALLGAIKSHQNFLLICSPGCFDGCTDNADDWLRREIRSALACHRNIVPVEMPGFVWPKDGDLPLDIQDIRRHGAFKYVHDHWVDTQPKFLTHFRRGGFWRETFSDWFLLAAIGMLLLSLSADLFVSPSAESWRSPMTWRADEIRANFVTSIEGLFALLAVGCGVVSIIRSRGKERFCWVSLGVTVLGSILVALSIS